MFVMRNRVCALISVAFLFLAGCQAPDKTATPGTVTFPPAAAAPPGSSDGGAPQPAGNQAAPDNSKDQPAPTPIASSGGLKGNVTAVRAANAQSGWVGGEGWIARTDDGGRNWQTQYAGGGTIRQLFALNDQEAWAATDKGELLATSDGGKRWAAAGKAPNEAFLHFVSKSEAFSAGMATTDGGKSWSALPVPEGIVGDAYFHDNARGWAVIQNGDTGIVQRTTDGGKTWQTVMSRKLVSPLAGALIRSAGPDDAWVEWIGGSGMTQTSYSLFHTTDGGKNWITVIAKSTAGGGPAPGFPTGYTGGPDNQGSKPGPLYVVDRKVAFMGGECPACDLPNTLGSTTDGGKTWVNGKAELPGYAGALLAMIDASHGWWICNDNAGPSVLYTTSDGVRWNKTYTFPK